MSPTRRPVTRARMLAASLLPTLLLVGFDIVYEPEVVGAAGGAGNWYDGMTLPAVVLPGVLGLAIAVHALVLLPRALAHAQTRPAIARLARRCIVSMALAVVAGELLGSVPPPDQPFLVAGGWLVGGVALFALGALVAAVTKTTDGAVFVGNACFWPLVFISGAFVYPPVTSDALARVAGFTPLGAAVQLIQYAWFGADGAHVDNPVAVLFVGMVWAVIFWVIAGWALRRRRLALRWNPAGQPASRGGRVPAPRGRRLRIPRGGRVSASRRHSRS